MNNYNNVNNYTGYTVFGLSYEEVGEGNDGSITDFYSEIVNGFKFSSKTLRLSNDKYIDGNINLINNIPVMTPFVGKNFNSKIQKSLLRYFRSINLGTHGAYKLYIVFVSCIN